MPKYIPKFVSLLLETIFQPLAKICPSHIKNTVIYYVLFFLLFLLQTTLQKLSQVVKRITQTPNNR